MGHIFIVQIMDGWLEFSFLLFCLFVCLASHIDLERHELNWVHGGPSIAMPELALLPIVWHQKFRTQRRAIASRACGM
jgi:hypothetical protein